ncbi:tigger transposable element-derived protein [Plakobranchus ocellatus]|uniref:Tigger transposable element-derived protein n=1 Tax=Plakobranchus ocellatus TaxID=259542 RepID=A0AAV4CIC2_9GAST|nr:tigger transposable element-derived protein [Plakobranchus ocellatus]
MCACVSATGHALPPAYIFRRVNFKDHMLHGAPNGSKGFANPSGWMNRDLFPQVLEHFISIMNVSLQNPRLLIMDNHDSHVTFNVIDLARQSGLTILTFPPHYSHRMQPLDVSVFGPFKTYYNQRCTEYLLAHREKGITIYEVASISATPFYKAFTIENIQAGLKKAGVYPINRNIFPEDAFVSAEPSDRPLPVQNQNDQEGEVPMPVPEMAPGPSGDAPGPSGDTPGPSGSHQDHPD